MTKRPPFQKAILKTLSDKKVISIDTVKQGVGQIIPQHLKANEKTDYAINRSIKNLLSDKLIESFNSSQKQYYRLTKRGKQKLNNINLECQSSLVSTKWDGFWRIVLLDLPEERKNEREALRYLLKKAGFACMKNSVWISMYPFEHLFSNIKKDLSLTSELIILVTDKIDEETEGEFFSLCGIK